MIYPFIEFDPAIGDDESRIEELLSLRIRPVVTSDGEVHDIECFNAIWQKLDYLTAFEEDGKPLYTAAELLREALRYERGRNKPYDLNLSFSCQVAMSYEHVRLSLLELDAAN